MSITVSKTFDNEAAAAAWLTGKPAAATMKPAAEAAKPKNTREAMVAVMNKLKAEAGPDACRAIVKEVSGEALKMADLPDKFIDGVFNAATKALADKAAADAAASDDV